MTRAALLAVGAVVGFYVGWGYASRWFRDNEWLVIRAEKRAGK